MNISDGILVTSMIGVLKTRFDNILLKSEFIHNEVIISFNIDNATNSLIIHVPGGLELKI